MIRSPGDERWARASANQTARNSESGGGIVQFVGKKKMQVIINVDQSGCRCPAFCCSLTLCGHDQTGLSQRLKSYLLFPGPLHLREIGRHQELNLHRDKEKMPSTGVEISRNRSIAVLTCPGCSVCGSRIGEQQQTMEEENSPQEGSMSTLGKKKLAFSKACRHLSHSPWHSSHLARRSTC